MREDDIPDHERAEGVDEDISRAMLSAEAALKSTTRAPWSEALHEAMTTVYILKKLLTQFRTKIDMSAPIEVMQTTLAVRITLPSTFKEANAALKAAQRNARNITRAAADLAKTRRTTRIQARQLASPDTQPDKIEKQFDHEAASKELYTTVPSARPGFSSGISMIQVPDDPQADPKADDTTFHSIVEPVEVEETIIARNERHFSQAKEAPLAQPRIIDLMDFSGTSSLSNQLIAGTADVDAITLDRFGRALLRRCRRILPEATPDISLETFKSAYKNCRVGTSTSPSGRHLSHQHVLFQPHGIPLDQHDAIRTAEDSREANWDAQVSIVQYAIKHGYSFKRWHQVVNAMIEKEAGNCKLHRLRVIHLYESDYNALLGIKLREMMHQCEDNNVLHPGAYGSRANRQSLDPVFIEVLQWDYASITRWPEVKFGNDTSSCYDRHVPSVNNVILRAMGLHEQIAKIHGSMLEQAIYRIKTQLGISQSSYSHSRDSPVFGTGQGSKASPPVWLTLCNFLFQIYDDHCWGAHYFDMQGTTSLKLGMTGFVDDNSCNVNCRPHEQGDLIARATHDSQLWNDVLWGGMQILEAPKCCVHIAKTSFTAEGAPFFGDGLDGDPVVITDSHGEIVRMKQLSAYSPYKTLGTWQALSKRQKTQFQELQKKSSRLSRVLALSACSGNAAWLYFSSIFQKGIGYPLAVSRLTRDQLSALQGPMISLTLNRMRFTKRLSRALVHGPHFYGGLEFNSFVTMQGSSKLLLLMRHLRCPGQPHDLALIVIDCLQHLSGVGYPIFERTNSHLPHLEGIWLPTVRDYLRSIDGSLQIANLMIQPCIRKGDQYLMEIALDSGKFSHTEICRLNYCRLYLQVLSLADISTASGTHLAVGIAMGVKSSQQSQSSLKEPLQERPGNHVWSLWRKFLRLFSDKHGKLDTPLGPWPRSLPPRRLFPSVYSPSRQILYRRSGLEYSYHFARRILVHDYAPKGHTDDLPADCIPVDINDRADGWHISRVRASPPPPPSTTPIYSFQEYLATLPTHIASLLVRVDLLGNDVFSLCDRLRCLDDMILVSDGGAMADYGSYGWVLSISEGERLAQGSGTAFGLEPRSFRAEGYGAKAGALFISHVFEYCDKALPNGVFTFYCDNQGLLRKLERFRSYSHAILAACLHSEWDVVSSVHRIHHLFGDLPPLIHVKGHQDSRTQKCMLPIPAQLNIEADELATQEMRDYGDTQPHVPFDPASGVMLSINGVSVTRNIEHTIRTHAHLQPLRQYYMDRFDWNKSTFNAIDWESFSAVYKKYPRTRTFFSKLGWKKLAVGERLYRWSPSYDHRCPTCHGDHETDDHVFQCHSAFHADWRFELFTKIQDVFGGFLDPDLLAIIRLGLTSYFTNTSPCMVERFPAGFSSTPYRRLILEQQAIGWDHFFRGKISKEWTHIQFRYARTYNLLKDSEGWSLKLIRMLATYSFQLWDFRNGARHGRDSATKFQKTYEQAQREVREMYTLRDQVLPQDRDLFKASADLHVQDHLSSLKSWLQINKALIQFSVRQAKAKALKQKYKIQQYFRPNRKRSKSRIRVRASQKTQVLPKSLYTTRLSQHFTYQGIKRSLLPTIPEDFPLRDTVDPNAVTTSDLPALRAPDSALRASGASDHANVSFPISSRIILHKP